MGSVGKGISRGVKSITRSVGKFVSKVFKDIGSAISSIFSGWIPTPDAPSYEDSGVTVTKQGSNINIPVVYGFRRVGGTIVFAETNGDNNKYLYVVYVLSEGACYRAYRLFIEGHEIPDLNGYFNNGGANVQTRTVTTGRFADRVKYEFINGADSIYPATHRYTPTIFASNSGSQYVQENQVVSPLLSETKSWEKTKKRFNGLSVLVCRFEWKKIESQEQAEANPFQGGIPSIEVDISGRLCQGATFHQGTGKDYYNSNFTGYDINELAAFYSNNGASILLEFLTNTRYGCGLPITEIDAYSFKKAADKCRQYVGEGTQENPAFNAHTVGAVINTGNKLIDNVRYLLSSIRGYLPYIEGRYTLLIEDAGNEFDIDSASITSVFDVSEEQIIGELVLQGESKASKFNKVIVRYTDPDYDFTEQQQVYSDTTARSQDGEDLTGEFTFTGITNPKIAYNMAKFILNKSRNQRYVQFTATPELLEVTPGDIIRLTSGIMNISNQMFRVVNMSLNTDGTVVIEGREHDPTDYPYVDGPVVISPAKVYRPDSYSTVPISAPVSQVPLSIRPPAETDDGDTKPVTGYDSANQPIEGTNDTVNDEPPPAADKSAQTQVVEFDTSIVSPSTSALVYNLIGYQFALNAQFLKFSDDRVLITIYFIPPANQELDQLYVKSYNINNRSQGATASGRVDFTDLANPQSMSMWIDPNTYYVPRWRNSNTGDEFKDASTGSYSALAYTDINGVSQTGKTLEAAINYTIQNYYASQLSNTAEQSEYQTHDLTGRLT